MKYALIYRNPGGILRRSVESSCVDFASCDEFVVWAHEWQKRNQRHSPLGFLPLHVLRQLWNTLQPDTPFKIEQAFLEVLKHPTFAQWVADSKVPPTPTVGPRREPDHAPFWWDLRADDGTLNVSPDAAWDAIKAMCKG